VLLHLKPLLKKSQASEVPSALDKLGNKYEFVTL